MQLGSTMLRVEVHAS